MSQRRQDARRAKQERRREARHDARVAQRRTSTVVADRPSSAAAPPPKESFWTTRNRWIAIGAVAGIVVLALGFWIYRSVAAPLPGTKYETQGNDHLSDIDQPHPPYNSNPPTSGWHLPPVPRPGIYTRDHRPEEFGHFMEHGGVWILYNCPDNSCPEDVQQLTQITNGAIDRGRPVALAPYTRMDSKFALIAWQYLLTLDELDRAQIDDFVSRHACRYNPEGGPYCSGVRGKVADGTNPDREMEMQGSPTPFSVFNTPAPAASPTPAR